MLNGHNSKVQQRKFKMLLIYYATYQKLVFGYNWHFKINKIMERLQQLEMQLQK